ncbi:PDR/VanB family oxidoreductase [Amycolatopsis methanolica]|uniref:Phthalate 4,5-dioxygenase reductase subunit n=1 Tax=Amycolatopsis methanolica 239 TaxID=1068978 RepID=A0A076MZW0_AMYME|nr:PDR/VanB family oxidoreductase [Amycolatopsis methanolica]AIJ26123.1 phthalate 4,5-dioxygenase reductase subunit [Amycolatopsis methanolica 239]
MSDTRSDLRLTVVGLTQEAEGVVSVLLGRDDGSPLPSWSAGAHIEVHLAPGLIRHYSLCGPADAAGLWRIAVLRSANSRGGSVYIHDQLGIGDAIDVVGPRNHFTMEAGASQLFIAGGIGITPILPMIAAAEAAGSDWRLLYGGRCRASMAFLKELECYRDRVTIAPQDETGLLDLPAAVRAMPGDAHVYVCGPEPLINAAQQACAQLPPGRLRFERFTPVSTESAGPSTGFEVELAQSAQTLYVAPEQSIVEVLEAAGIDIPTSCREGICGTCEVAVLDGTPDHRDSVLDDAEKAANDCMMTCVGRALTPKLVLDL